MAELAIGAVSLTFQIFAGCVKGYQLLSDAHGLEENYRYVRVRLQIELFRLLDWAQVVRLLPQDSALLLSRANKGLLLSVLEQQYELLSRFGRYDNKLAPLTHPFILEVRETNNNSTSPEVENPRHSEDAARFPQRQTLLKKALSYAQQTRLFPLRLKWAALDKAKVDGLLLKLASLNDFLKDTLQADQSRQFMEYQERTMYQILQLNSTVQQLLVIIGSEKSQALKLLNSTGATGVASGLVEAPVVSDFNSSHSPSRELGSLARVKAFNIAIQAGDLTDLLVEKLELGKSQTAIFSAGIEVSKIILPETAPEEPLSLEYPRTEAILRASQNGHDKHVWIEWVPVRLPKQWCGAGDTTEAGDSHGSLTNLRLSALVALMQSESNLESFHTAHCLGFFFQPRRSIEDTPLCGLVFQKPHGYIPDLRPISLVELLRGHGKSEPLPSLSRRIAIAQALARSLERLHAVNWLHKGIRSYNVLFFREKCPRHDDTGHHPTPNHCHCEIDWHNPKLTGFEYSRPNAKSDWTQKGAVNPAHDIYRHPNVQLDSGRDMDEGFETFKRVFDIYSLGIVFIEIACWRPIDVIMAVDMETAKLKHTVKIRRLLLDDRRYMDHVKGQTGSMFYSVIKSCLLGTEAFGLSEDYSDTNSDDAAKLQAEFYTQVVQKLNNIVV